MSLGARRIRVLIASLAIYLVALEALLQAAAWVAERSGGDLVPEWLSGRQRILCVGDSNTYGLYLEREEAYPQQLEAIWARSQHRPEIQVLNAGFPGQNSSHLLRDFPRLLDATDPDLVLLLIGANDYWTRPVAVGDADPEGWLQRLRRRSRVAGLVHMLRRAGAADELIVTLDPRDEGARTGTARFGDEEFALGWQEGAIDLGAGEGLERNLRALVVRARERGSEIALLTYASQGWFYERASAVGRRAARAAGAPLIDVTPAFETACPTGDCRELFFADGHPTAEGYRLVAERVAAFLEAR